jgi:hypothetical protein
MTALRGGEADCAFDMNAAVIKLLALAADKREHRSRPVGETTRDGITASPFRLCTIDDFPEPSAEWERADAALKSFADELAQVGGLDLMVEVFDEAVERHGYRSVSGVSSSWSGCHGWWH